MGTSRRAATSGLLTYAKGSDPQEARREHEAYGGSGETQTPQRKGFRAHGRGNDLFDKVYRNWLLLRPEPGEQDFGAEEVHVVWHPVGVAHNGFEGPLSEDRPTRQGHLGYALADIRQALCLSQRHDRSVAEAVLR